jgi:hypothetical protein
VASLSEGHRGAAQNLAEFAVRFVDGRLNGFEKDMSICLTPVELPSGRGKTHAYFPALAACCGLLEYMTALHRGSIHGIGWRQVSDWATAFLPQPDYDPDTVRVFFEAFRHSVAHRGIASGVWVERVQGKAPRRVTWKVHANSAKPSCHLKVESGELKRDSPWRCNYTHRMHIHLKRLQVDLRAAAKKYRDAVRTDAHLQDQFRSCMKQLYPTSP